MSYFSLTNYLSHITLFSLFLCVALVGSFEEEEKLFLGSISVQQKYIQLQNMQQQQKCYIPMNMNKYIFSLTLHINTLISISNTNLFIPN